MAMVSEYDKRRAVENSGDLVIHQLDRVWDAVTQARDLVSEGKVEEALAAISKTSQLCSKAQQLSYSWKGFALNAKPKEDPAPVPEVPAEIQQGDVASPSF